MQSLAISTILSHSMGETAMPRPSSNTDTSDGDRPPIWIDGQQRARFGFRPWLKVGEAMARRWPVPHLDTAADRLSGFGAQIMAGRFQMGHQRLGRAARYLPSRRSDGDCSGFAPV